MANFNEGRTGRFCGNASSGHDGVENNTYISSRGRLVMPKLKYWEVGRRPVESCSIFSFKRDIQAELKNPPALNNSVLNTMSREREKIGNSELKVPPANKIKTPAAKPKRRLPTPPLESKKLNENLKSKVLNESIRNEGKQSLSSSLPKSNTAVTRKTAKGLKEPNCGHARQTYTENENTEAIVTNNNEFGGVKKKVVRTKNNKDKLPLGETTLMENATKTKARKLQSRGQKRKSSENETDLRKRVKILDESPEKNDDNFFEESFQPYGTTGASNYFEVPSPGNVLNSIKKKNATRSGRETSPIKYICSFVDHTDNKTLNWII